MGLPEGSRTAGATGGVPLVVVMGPAGVGKSTVGKRLSVELGVPFVDGDEEHSRAAIARMAAGIPLDDALRKPWLHRLNRILTQHAGGGLVLACSALTPAYRRQLARGLEGVVFVALTVPREVLIERLAFRRGHFAGPALLDSQLAKLELDDAVHVVDASGSVDATIAAALSAVKASLPP